MRWKLTPPPNVGDIRTLTRFLLLPKEINHELRWLERATWTEKCCRSRHGPYWWPEAWAQEPPQ